MIEPALEIRVGGDSDFKPQKKAGMNPAFLYLSKRPYCGLSTNST